MPPGVHGRGDVPELERWAPQLFHDDKKKKKKQTIGTAFP